MSWDNPVHSFSYPNGEPQTPTRTPTTTVFGDSAFQTPKLESSFFDPRVTWDTSDPYASSPEFLRTPQRFGLSTPSNPLRLPDTVPGRTGGGDALQGFEQETDTAKRICSTKPNGGSGEDGPRTVDSAKSAASMQTPPPSSASRRKITGLDNVIDTNRKHSPHGGHLETPSRLLGASPRFFAGLQSSPDPFDLAAIDPSASPFFPQQRLFWDNDIEQQGGSLSLSGNSMNMDPFGSSASTSTNQNHNQTLQDARIPQLPAIDATLDLPEVHGPTYSLSAAPSDAALFPAPFSTSPRLPIAKAEDPALFLSSPARRFGGPQLSPDKRLFSKQSRQPYHHQTEEFKREELRRAQSINHSLTGFDEEEDDDDDFTPRRSRPGLTRSVTHAAINAPPQRSVSGQSASGMMASSSGIRKSPSKGRSSPMKPLRQQLTRANTVASAFPTRSQSVILRIGKDGRAKTEMQTVAETGLTDPVSGMEIDRFATENEFDSADLSEYPTVPTRNSSFAYSDVGEPTVAHSDSGSRPHSKGSYTSTAASSQSGRASPWASSSRVPARRPVYRADEWNRTTPKRQSMLINSDLTFPSVGTPSGLHPENEDDSGDAQHALRKVLEGRGRLPRSQTIGYGSRSNRSSLSFAHLRSSPPRFGADFDLNSRPPNTSPTTMTDPDLATPTTERYSNPSNGTRCVCQSMDNGGHLMIQCESCNHWLHTKCVGLERSNLPSVYVCVFCAQTPTRKNRVRGPVSATEDAPTSPLAHKSFRFR